MTAIATPADPAAAPAQTVRLPVPPPGGFTVHDLPKLEHLGHRFQLIDGDVRVMAAATYWHNEVVGLFWAALRPHTPAGFVAHLEIGVQVDDQTAPEPDVTVLRRDAVGMRSHLVDPATVLLAIEVESPGSRHDDRILKPTLYAEAGVRYLWRVENQDDRPVVFAFALNEASRVYEPYGVFRDKIDTDQPFPIALDLSVITPQ